MEESSPPRGAVPDLLPARMLNEFAYCPRLFYLEWVQGEFADSVDTVEGRFVGRRTAKEGGALAKPEDAEAQPEKIHARSVLLSSEALGLSARIDLIEGEGRRVTPVEYKKGTAPDLPEGAWEPERVQLCAQALILRDHGYACDEGVIYFAGSKKRVTIPISEQLAARTLELAAQAKALAASGIIPPPLVDSPKCPRCSLVGICLPDEVNALAPSPGAEARRPEDVRRLFPARDDAFPVYVQEQGARVSKKGDLLEIRGREGAQQVRLLEVSQLCLYGNVSTSTQVVRTLCERGIPLCYFTFGGWFYGITHGMSHKNVELRQRQYGVARDRGQALRLARQFVDGKVRNCRTLLRRNAREPRPAALEELSRLAGLASQAPSLDTLLGFEGAAGQVYFANFPAMLKPPEGAPGLPAFDFHGRNRRPPTDPVNAVLSFLYAILAKDLTVVLLSVGFDPHLGFYHQPKYGRPALALDLMEEFRPLVADSTAITVINNGEVAPGDFVQRGNACALTEKGRKAVLRAYERRLDALVRHPVFGYTISYRRVFEVQARLLGRALSGEIVDYPAFSTR